MNATSLINLPADQLRAIAGRHHILASGGTALERDLGLAVALIAIAAATVLALLGSA